MRRGVDTIQLFKELFSQPKLDIIRVVYCLRVWSRGHPIKLGDVAIFYNAKFSLSPSFTSLKRVDRISPPPFKHKGNKHPIKSKVKNKGSDKYMYTTYIAYAGCLRITANLHCFSYICIGKVA